jgi:hypothetical protein
MAQKGPVQGGPGEIIVLVPLIKKKLDKGIQKKDNYRNFTKNADR